jgi:hypothetical protein
VVIDAIHVTDIAGLEPKDYPPVSADAHRVEALQFTLQRMEFPAGCIHVSWLTSPVQRRQDQPQALRVRRLYPGPRTITKERLKAFVAKIPDQECNV